MFAASWWRWHWFPIPEAIVFSTIAGVLHVGTVMRFVSRSVMTGLVKARAILIFMAQLPEFKGAAWQVYAMVAAGIAIIYLLPRVTKAVPSPLVAIVVQSVVAILLKVDVRRVGDFGELPSALPVFSAVSAVEPGNAAYRPALLVGTGGGGSSNR